MKKACRRVEDSDNRIHEAGMGYDAEACQSRFHTVHLLRRERKGMKALTLLYPELSTMKVAAGRIGRIGY